MMNNVSFFALILNLLKDFFERSKKRVKHDLRIACLFVLQLNAMENSTPTKVDSSIPINNICYLPLLPSDICNEIMLFVGWEAWETKKAFIRRTRNIQALPSLWVNYLAKNKYGSWQEEPLCELSPDGTKIAIVKLFYQDLAKPTLSIIDKWEKKLYDGQFPYQIYQDIALAQSGYMVATIQKQERLGGEIIHDYKNILTVQEIVQEKKEKQEIKDISKKRLKLKEIKKIILPDGFEASKLAFNKQDTYLIVHGFQYGSAQDPRKNTYRILKLENQKKNPLDYNYVPSEKEKGNALQVYFRYYMICKKY